MVTFLSHKHNNILNIVFLLSFSIVENAVLFIVYGAEVTVGRFHKEVDPSGHYYNIHFHSQDRIDGSPRSHAFENHCKIVMKCPGMRRWLWNFLDFFFIISDISGEQSLISSDENYGQNFSPL